MINYIPQLKYSKYNTPKNLLKFSIEKVIKTIPITTFSNNNLEHIHRIFLPKIQQHTSAKKTVNYEIHISTNTSKLISNRINSKNKNHIKYEAGVYSIACKGCDKNILVRHED